MHVLLFATFGRFSDIHRMNVTVYYLELFPRTTIGYPFLVAFRIHCLFGRNKDNKEPLEATLYIDKLNNRQLFDSKETKTVSSSLL